MISGRSKTKQKLTLLTFNVGLMDVKFFGRHIIEPAPYVEERLRALPRVLLRSGADIIALQEVYRQQDRDFLIAGVKAVYPHHFYRRNRRLFRFEDSLMFFSRYPLEQKSIFPFQVSSLEERLFAFKGVSVISVKVAGIGHFTFYNTHTTAGGIRDQENKAIEKIRAEQLRQVIHAVHRHKSGIKIILGDFNAGPEVSRGNYDIIISAGYVDAFYEKHHAGRNTKISWDPRNPLNVSGPDRKSLPQRIDHVFVPRQILNDFQISRAKIVFDQAVIKVGSKKITASDHYGVLVTLEKKL